MIEQIDKLLPKLHVVSAFALIPKPVYLRNVGAFVIASEHVNHVGVLNFVAEKEANALNALLTSVHIVAQEEVPCLWRTACIVEKPQEVKILSMDVRSNCQWRRDLQEHRLLADDFLSSRDDLMDG